MPGEVEVLGAVGADELHVAVHPEVAGHLDAAFEVAREHALGLAVNAVARSLVDALHRAVGRITGAESQHAIARVDISQDPGAALRVACSGDAGALSRVVMAPDRGVPVYCAETAHGVVGILHWRSISTGVSDYVVVEYDGRDGVCHGEPLGRS